MHCVTMLRRLFSSNISRNKSIYLKNPKALQLWFGGCAGMSLVTIAVGGITRLTESGLSMTNWKFIGDIFLPRNEEQWAKEFEKYKEFPEWLRLNKQRDMNLKEFKFIYFMEYLHRNCGKATGLVYIAPLPFLWSSLSKIGKFRTVSLGSLLGLQGFLGWYMVKSGLDEDLLGIDRVPRVSHYRLAIHLSAALLLYSGLVWSAMDCSKNIAYVNNVKRIKPLAFTMLGLTSVTIVIGALVAGLDAGMIYDTFPLMGNSFVPDDYVSSKYTNNLQNILENPAAVQFNHRIAGISCVCLAAYLYKKCRNISLLKRPATAVLHSSLLQMGLGICTVLYGVPVSMASAHQINSMAMLTSVLWLLKVLCK